MLTKDGPKVLEYNCRFGDPETQVILPLLQTDLYEVMQACITGKLHEINLQWDTSYCATIVCAAPGYPEAYPKGLPIHGLEQISDGIVFHAGTKITDGQVVTNGGRVIAMTTKSETLPIALDQAYTCLEKIQFDRMQYRTDIGDIYD